MIKKTLFFTTLLLFTIGCSSKKAELENLTALKWHQKIYKDIQNNNLDDADNNFLSLEAEHPTSIYIKIDLLNLFLAHESHEEYDLSLFYLNEYKKRFATKKELPWINYQEIKLYYKKYNNAYTNQELLLEIINMCKNYKNNFFNSNYIFEVNTILAKAELTNKYLNDRIYKLYKKLEKPKAAKKYKTEIPKNSKPPVIPWYKKLFYW